MLRPFTLLLPLALCAPVFAQAVEIKASGDDQTLQVAIRSTLQSSVTAKTLINGEEGGGRGGGPGGAGGDTTTTQEVEFVQGPAKDNWREYKKLAAKESRKGPDGEPRDTDVTGGLQGKKVWLKTTDTGLALTEGEGEKAQPVPAAMAANLPGRLALNGFLPTKAVAVGEEFDLGASFVPALRGLLHPVTPDRGQAAGAGRGRGQGGGDAGGGQGGRGQGGQGGQAGGPGGRMGGRMGGGASGTMLQLIGGGKLETKATGKLTAVEEKDGQKVAVIAITARLTGKGKAADLGVRGGAAGAFGGGRRGGEAGGQGAADTGKDDIDATFELTGTVRVNLNSQQVAGVTMNGDIAIAREIKRTMQGRDGEEMEMESTSTTKSKLQLDATCATAK